MLILIISLIPSLLSFSKLISNFVGIGVGVGGYYISTIKNNTEFVWSQALTFGLLGGMLAGGIANFVVESGGIVKSLSVLGKGLSTITQNGIVNGVADIFNESLNMISRMAVFNEVLGIGLTALNINSDGAVARFINDNSFLKGLDSLGLNLFSQISYYTKLAKEGNFLDVVAAVTSGANQLLYTPQMYLFSFGTRIGMRVLAPILQNIPGLGEIMKVLGKVETGVSVLDTA